VHQKARGAQARSPPRSPECVGGGPGPKTIALEKGSSRLTDRMRLLRTLVKLLQKTNKLLNQVLSVRKPYFGALTE
jgi:hypothetical protein